MDLDERPRAHRNARSTTAPMILNNCANDSLSVQIISLSTTQVNCIAIVINAHICGIFGRLLLRRVACSGGPFVFCNCQIGLSSWCGEIDRIFKLVSARLAGPYVPNTALGPMLRPFWCNDSATTLRTLDDRPVTHGDILLVPRHPRNPYLKNQAKLGNPDQLILQDLSASRAAICAKTRHQPVIRSPRRRVIEAMSGWTIRESARFAC